MRAFLSGIDRSRAPERKDPRGLERRRGMGSAASMAFVALVVAMLPSAAQASVSATARLIEGLDTLPGLQSFSIQVRNTERGGFLSTSRIDTVSIILPREVGVRTSSGAELTAPTGWTVRRLDNRGLQRYLYHSENSGIAAGANQHFRFPAEVAAPFDRDQIGTFRVSVSDDDGATTTSVAPDPGGTLSTRIRVLEVLPGSLQAAAPAGVVDGTGTAGQILTYEYYVKNHAHSALEVSPSLTASGPEEIGAAASAVISSGGEGSFRHQVTLGPASSDRVTTFTGGATATDSVARTASAPFTVQAPARLVLRTNTFSPTHIRSGTPITYQFSGAIEKIGTPSVTLEDGALAFGANTAQLSSSPSNYPSGTAIRTQSWFIGDVVGSDGPYAASFTLTGIDGNGVNFNQSFSVPDLITIDNIAPFIDVDVELPFDDYGTAQTAVKQGDRPSITGGIVGADRLDALELSPAEGSRQPVPPSGITYSPTADGANFFSSPAVLFADEGSVFRVEAIATDRAGNVGAATSPDVRIDNVRPTLTQGFVRSATTVLVGFHEDVVGSCDPTEWSVGGRANVGHVTYPDGTTCSAGAGDEVSNAFRILHLTTPLDDPESSTTVAYSPRAVSPARDGAGNVAPAASRTAPSTVLPPAPVITEVLRRDDVSPIGAYEPAVFDEDSYWTNVGGSDGLLVRFDGGRVGRQVQVLTEAGNVIVSADSASGRVNVPLGASDGIYVRKLRLVSSSGSGPETNLRITLDGVRPALAAATLVQEDRIQVRFSEKIWAGSDFAIDWYGLEHNAFNLPGDPDDDYVYYQAQRVDLVDPFTRLLSVDMQGFMPFAGAEYMLSAQNGERYEDRAGNKLPDSRAVS